MVSQGQDRIAALEQRNGELMRLLEVARDQLGELRAELAEIAQPPQSFATFVGWAGELADVNFAGRKMRVAVATSLADDLAPGTQVLLNGMNVIVGKAGPETTGTAAIVREVLDAHHLLVVVRGEDERVVQFVHPEGTSAVSEGDTVTVDLRTDFAYHRVERTGVEALLLEEVPDVDYSAIGGLAGQIERIRDAIELPLRHPELYVEHNLRPPRGLLLYGPPGCGKTLIAKAVAHSLGQAVGADRSYFLSIKGPELLNKYVGETERYLRTIFERARAKAAAGSPVVVFFDEMEALFRARGSGVSSDMENTIVPQLLTELDGVETLSNVIVVGASNREDMIDPAILRPGRLDVKIEIARPNEAAAFDIFSKYVTAELPLTATEVAAHGGDKQATARAMIAAAVAKLFEHNDVGQYISGALIRNIVDRAKTGSIKQTIAGGAKGLSTAHLLAACAQEIQEARAVAAGSLAE